MTGRTADRFKVSLSRDLGLFDVTMIGIGAMIGAGIFGLTGIAAGVAGAVGVLVAFLLNGLATTLTGLTYAELGAAFPQAGGGYAWVREALPRVFGFYAGWLSWFSHSVACALYAVLFGTFFAELIELAGLEISDTDIALGLSAEELLVKALAVVAAIAFLMVNVRGSSETGLVGNVITLFKIVVLLTVVGFGIAALIDQPGWTDHFLRDPGPFPEGAGGVILAMGLTFVAFEGYEIIAQSGEEVVDPERNLPRAIFTAIAIVVVIYLAVAFVAVGAVQQDSGLPNWMYLGENGERAMIETARIIMPAGALVMILGGLASTMSALNATIYSSSRVSFAMGRDGDLPSVFGRIHFRNKTPHWAIWLSGLVVIAMAVLLPVVDVASGASITFLLLFLMVNAALIRLRKTHPDLPRPFRAPFVPWLQLLTIGIMLVLAVELARLSGIAWLVTIVWLLLGIFVYRRHGGAMEARTTGDTVLLEEATASTDYSVLVPVANNASARRLSHLGATLARANRGEVFALHVITVPRQIDLSDGRAFLAQGRVVVDEAVGVAAEHDVPVRTMVRLGRDAARSILTAAAERKADLLLMGWPGYMSRREHAFGSLTWVLAQNPPCDLAVVRFNRTGPLRRILVPVGGGPNARLALELAVAQADAAEEETGDRPDVVGLHLLLPSDHGIDHDQRRQELLHTLDIGAIPLDLQIVPTDEVVAGILAQAEGFDQVVIGASNEGLLEQSLFGSIPQQVAEAATANVIMAKRHDPVRFRLRNWLWARNGTRKGTAAR